MKPLRVVLRSAAAESTCSSSSSGIDTITLATVLPV
jgi:hypothetical protein